MNSLPIVETTHLLEKQTHISRSMYYFTIEESILHIQIALLIAQHFLLDT